MHARWASYFKQFNFVIQHKYSIDNKIPDALCKRVSLSVSLQSEIIDFDLLKELYEKDEDFEEIWEKCSMTQPTQVSYYGGFSF